MSDANGSTGTNDVVPKAEFEALKAKHTEITGKLTDYEKLQERIGKWGGIEKISANLEALSHLEAERAKEKPEDLKAWKAQQEQAIRESVQKDVDTWKSKAETASSKLKERIVIDVAFSEVASKLHDGAKDDFKDLVRKYGDLDEKENVIFKDADGKTLYKEGSTTEPLDAKGFAAWAMKQKPHYFKSSTVEGDRETGTKSAASYDGNNITVEQYLGMSDAEHAKLPVAVRAELAFKARQGKSF